jgi:hypothetical protein
MKAHGLGAIALFVLTGCAANLTDSPVQTSGSTAPAESPKAAPSGGSLEAGGNLVAAGSHGPKPEPASSVPAGCVPPSPLPPDADYVPGEVLFKFKQPPTQAELEAAKAHFGFTELRELGTIGIYKASFAGTVRQKLVDMHCDGRFEFAEPNGIVRIDPRETSGELSSPQ